MNRGSARALGSLNDAQLDAVSVDDGPALVVAGAGTGKTRVIVERIMRLLADGVSPESILALTFTEKAAGEMLDRVNQARNSVTLDATIATFNGFGNDLLTAYGNEWGLGSLRLLGETGQLVFLREHLDDFELDYFAPVSRPDGQLSLLAGYVSQLKQQLVRTEDYVAYAKRLPAGDEAEQLERYKHRELAEFYATYVQLCRSEQVIDYDDQLFLTIRLLEARPNILKALQDRYQYILVDEFQDTNPMQSALVDLLAGKRQNVMVVGDDDQSIYGWRGATLANILDFKKRYPTAKDITLIENYRSTQSILDSAYQLIQYNNPDRLEVMNGLTKRLHAQQNDGPPPYAVHFSTLDAELAWVADDIQKRLQKGQDPSGIAILARRNQGVQKMHETLELYDVAHAVTGLSSDIYEQTVVKQLIEALKAISDPLDEIALFHTLGGPLFTISPSTLAEAAAAARRAHEPLADVLARSEQQDLIAALDKLKDWRNRTQELGVGEIAYQVITDSGWKHTLYERAEHDTEVFTQVQALSKYFKTLKEFEHVSGVGSVHNYLMNLQTLQAAGSGFDDATLDISDSLINVLSVHRAKGLEWDTVYIIDCTEGSFPMRNFGSSLSVPEELKANHHAADSHLAEERRLMYVAATRAKRELILTYADQHGSGSRRKPSRFLDELLGQGHDQGLQDMLTQTNLELFATRDETAVVPLPQALLQDGKLVLSVSQIDCFLRCPQDFYYLYVLGMPVPPDPTLQYGTAIHAAIEAMHRGLREGTVPSYDSLEKAMLESLPMSGYASVRSRERAYAQARRTLTALYERIPQATAPVETEQSFTVELPDSQLKIRGRIDAVYQMPGGGVEIRDFKTGTSVTTAEKAKRRATASSQLALYALAWQLMHDEMPALLTLDFVETGIIGHVKKQPKSLETLGQKLRDMVSAIQSGTYEAGKDHAYCSHPL